MHILMIKHIHVKPSQSHNSHISSSFPNKMVIELISLKSQLIVIIRWVNEFPGAIFEQGTDEVQSAFKFAVLNHNLNISARKFELQAYVDVINTADAFKLSRLSKKLQRPSPLKILY